MRVKNKKTHCKKGAKTEAVVKHEESTVLLELYSWSCRFALTTWRLSCQLLRLLVY